MSAENDTVHLNGKYIDTMLLALCCLEAMWKTYPDIVRAICIENEQPDLLEHGALATELLTVLTALKS